jgi:type IV pilus assembly PilX-like protein
MTAMRPTTPRPALGRESGSAYMMSLLVLVVLTILGLALVLVTQSEMSIGSNELTLQRTFYEADSGVAIATARVLVNNDHRPVTLTLDEPGTGLLGTSLLGFKSEIHLAPVVPLSDAPCNLCEINNAGTYNERAYRKINNVITVTATRRTAIDPTPLAQKTVSAMIEVQPWKSTPEAYSAITDPTQLSQVKY